MTISYSCIHYNIIDPTLKSGKEELIHEINTMKELLKVVSCQCHAVIDPCSMSVFMMCRLVMIFTWHHWLVLLMVNHFV